MRDDHAHVMQVKLCKANTQGVTINSYVSLYYISYVSLSLSQIFKIINMPNIWKRENQLMALEKKIEDTQFGSILYTFLD